MLIFFKKGIVLVWGYAPNPEQARLALKELEAVGRKIHGGY